MTGEPFLVTALVSTYNSEAFIRGCLEDLTSQTLFSLGRLEIIVIDSGSRENEREIVREFQGRHPRIRLIRTEQRETIYQAWNRGIRAAGGRYLTNANTDDRHRPDALEVMARELDSDPEIALVYGDVFVTGLPHQTFDSHIRCGYHIRPEYAPEIMLSGCHMGPQPMWRRTLHDEIGWFDEEFVSAGDYEFWCRTATRHPLKHIPQFLGLYFENPEGICNADTSRGAIETDRVKEMYRGQFPPPGRSFTCNYQWLDPVTADRYVNICMITYNRLEFTRQAVEGLVRSTRFPHVLTVVDNGSSDGTRGYLLEMKRLGVIRNLVLLEENAGVAKASNLAWSLEPRAAYYLKLDNDIVIGKPGWLEALVTAVDAIPELGAAAYNFEPVSYPLKTVNGHGVRIKDYGNLGGACILIPRRTERLLGCWCEDYGLYSEEDADYGFRIRFAGLLNAYLEDERIGVHLPAGRAAAIDVRTLTASDGMEEHMHAEYRAWKDEQRRLNVGEDGMFARNIRAYRNGSKPLKVESAFVKTSAGSPGNQLRTSKGAGDMALSIKETKQEAQRIPDAGYLVTAMVSTYNSEQFIRECLEDLENQTIADRLEIIVVDAASPQAEGAVVADFQRRYSNITYIRTAARIGVYSAWNIAVTLAKGKYLSPFSTNDRLSKDAYEVMADALERNRDAALVYGDTYHTKIPHETFERHTCCGAFQWPDYSYDDLLRTCLIGPHPMWRRSVHESVGLFDESFTALGDQDFFLRVGALFPMLHIPRFTGLYWLAEDALSNREGIYLPEIRRIRSTYGAGVSEKADPPVSSSDSSRTEPHRQNDRLRCLAAREREENRFDQALAFLRQAREEGDTSVLADMGDCLALQGRFEEAMEHYSQAIVSHARDPKAHVGAGVIHILKQRFPEAAQAFAEALSTEPENAKALCGLGMARYGQGFRKAGTSYFVKALEADPENITALTELVKAAYDLDEFGEAVSCTRNYLLYHPGDLDMLFSFAGLLFKSGEYAEAREALERLTVLSPDYAGANELLAMIAGSSNPVTGEKEADQRLNPMAEEARLLKEEGKFEEALAVFSRIAGQAGHAAAVDIGDCLANLGRLDEAAVSYRQALKENGNDPKALVGLGVLGLLQGEEEQAAAWFNRALQIDSADARALCGLGMVRNMQNRFEEASAFFAGSLDADPEQLPALNGLVGCSYRLERFEEAERRLTEYLMYHPADLDMLFSLAGLCYRAGNLAAARDNLEKVLLFAPDYQGGRELLDKIREQSAA